MAAGSGAGGSRNIEAGRAFIRIGLNSKPLDVALKQIPKKLQSIGKKIAGVGLGLFAGGGAALAGITGLSKSFVDAGSDATDMAARLGTTTEILTALGYAAELAGGTLEDIEPALGKIQKAIAEGGTEHFVLGPELLDMNLEQQLEAVARAIDGIDNATIRGAAYTEIFGKSGRKLIPILQDMAKLRSQAAADGAIITSEEAERADRLGDSFTRIWTVIKSIGRGLGSAFLPTIAAAEQFAVRISQIGAAVRNFIAENSELFKTVLLVAAGVTAGGIALTAFGLALSTLGTILSSVIASVTFLVTPLGAVLGLVTALTGATIASMAEFGDFADLLNQLGGTFSEIWSGIKDAITAGDLALGLEIVSTGLQVVWEESLVKLEALWDKFLDRIGDKAREWAVSLAEGSWLADLGEGLSDMWHALTTGDWDLEDRPSDVTVGRGVAGAGKDEFYGGGDFGGGDINKSEARRRLDELEAAARSKALTADILAGLAAAREPFDMAGAAGLLNAPAMFGSTKGLFATGGLNSSLGVADETTTERIAKGVEKTNELLEDKKLVVWGA